MLGLPKSDPIHNGLLLNVLAASPQDVDPQYRVQFTALQHHVEILYTVRQEMRAVHPALAVIDPDAPQITAKIVNTCEKLKHWQSYFLELLSLNAVINSS
jgi:hypothetical protein